MPDYEPSPSETIDQIVQGLNSSIERWDYKDHLAPIRRPPLYADDATWAHDNIRTLKREAMSTDEVDVRKYLLLQLQTCFLPSLKQQLADLLKSLDLTNLSKEKPNLLDILETVSRLGQTFKQINTFLYSIAGIATCSSQAHKEYDHDYGGVKEFRCHSLIEKINHLMSEHIWVLFKRHIPYILLRSKDHPTRLNDRSDLITHGGKLIEGIARSSDYIDTIIQLSKRSDFNILQDKWRGKSNDLNCLLKRIAVRINPTTEEERLLIDAGLPEIPSTSKAIADDNHSTNTDQAEIDSNYRDTGSDTDSSIDQEDDESDTSCSTCSSEESFLRSLLIKLAQSAIPLIKLVRILFNKLSNPISQVPFTIGLKMSSMDIESVQGELSSLNCSIHNILNDLLYMYDCEGIMDELKSVKMLRERLWRYFDSSLVLLCFYLVPSTGIELELPISGNHSKTWFLKLREQFYLATKVFDKALYEFEQEIEL
ncbi:hypothetical protein PGTUg99_023851 [Puccinia graminis f. sp. tritici]|uniref:Uncharacterized protein n=1 Tax=Puccinia graminis f. sp. tritici TaxID=56615 RepID=A0A5B0P4D8_PUCGR|nr:hypothetical protein PGTUg99_023851 [Puccinia graminis f. sp. tritici]